MPRSRALRLALLATVVALTMSGCTGDEPVRAPTAGSATETTQAAPEPSTEPSSEPSTEPAGQPGKIPPPRRPALMSSADATGAQAAAEYFMSLYAYVFQTGDLTELDAMCHPTSEFCAGLRQSVAAHQSSGNVQTGGGATFVGQRVLDPTGALDEYEVVGLLMQEAFEVRDAAGALVAVQDETEVATSVFIHCDDSGQWLVRTVMRGAEG